MDYRNADGSKAEMCGNGIRVFARYLARRRAGPSLGEATAADRHARRREARDPQRPRIRGRPRHAGASSRTTSSSAPRASVRRVPASASTSATRTSSSRSPRHRRARRPRPAPRVPQLASRAARTARTSSSSCPSDPLVRDGVGLDPHARVRARSGGDPQLRHGRRGGRARGAALGGARRRRTAGRSRFPGGTLGVRMLRVRGPSTSCCPGRRRSSTPARSRSPERAAPASTAHASDSGQRDRLVGGVPCRRTLSTRNPRPVAARCTL